MTEFNTLGESADWQRDFEQRLRAAYTAAGLGEAAVARRVEEVRADILDWTVVEIAEAGTRVGHVAVVVTDDHGTRVGRQRGGDEPVHERRLPRRGGAPLHRPVPPGLTGPAPGTCPHPTAPAHAHVRHRFHT
ncbi:hypothetical protein [Streptomyces sp. MMS24-I29]|uniref:hypothetical protein n=1 Tax=Streptomyces sp. MMS24-I29 TaxID=3351480 RepID=UPI003C7C96BE